jgi:hypothetical protein
VSRRRLLAPLVLLGVVSPAVSRAQAAPPPSHVLGVTAAAEATPDDLVVDQRLLVGPRVALGAYGWSTKLEAPELEITHALATATLHVTVAPRLDLRIGAGVAAARYERSEIIGLDGPAPDPTGTQVRVRHDLQPAMVAGLSARLASTRSSDLDVVAVLGGSLGPDDEPIYGALFALRLELR